LRHPTGDECESNTLDKLPYKSTPPRTFYAHLEADVNPLKKTRHPPSRNHRGTFAETAALLAD
jgi:hypothetical protein